MIVVPSEAMAMWSYGLSDLKLFWLLFAPFVANDEPFILSPGSRRALMVKLASFS